MSERILAASVFLWAPEVSGGKVTSVELGRLELLVVLQQLVGVLVEQTLDLREVVALGELDGDVPVVEQHGAVDGLLDLADPFVAVDGALAQADELELLGQLQEELVVALSLNCGMNSTSGMILTTFSNPS
jgi:hypothetical protein